MKKQQYADLVETHNQTFEFNRFEKVIMASQRAKKLYDLDEAAKTMMFHKPGYQSLQEINDGKLRIQRIATRLPVALTDEGE